MDSRLTLALVLAATIALAGCTALGGDQAGGTEAPTQQEQTQPDTGDTDQGTEPTGEGSFTLLVSDQPTAISDFTTLSVTFNQARIFKQNTSGFETTSLDGQQVDLTAVTGDKATQLVQTQLDAGTYTKIELHTVNATGVVDGQRVSVTVPSEKLMITKPFTVSADQSTEFVFDIKVVKKGAGGYNLLPVIGESGVVGNDVPSINTVPPEQAKPPDISVGAGKQPGQNRTEPPVEVTSDASANAVINAQDTAFQQQATVAPGQVVKFENQDSYGHTVEISAEGIDKQLSAGGSVTLRFNEAGSFTVTCSIHPGMETTVSIEEGASPSTSSSTSGNSAGGGTGGGGYGY